MSTLVALLVIGVAIYAYRTSIRRHPYRPCRTCGVTGRRHSTLVPRAFRSCGRCNGTGRELRLFARDPERGAR